MIGIAMALTLCGCSDDGGTAGTGGSGGTGGTGDAASDAVACVAVSGTYALTATRDQASPGSCPNDVSYPPGLSATIEAQGGGYTVTISDGPLTSGTYSADCVASVFGCSVTGTCSMNKGPAVFEKFYDLEFSWSVGDPDLAGTETWTNYEGTSPMCTAGWTVTGARQ